jgi:hypothetical protein
MGRRINIGTEDLDIYVGGQHVLTIGEVSDSETINLFLTPLGEDACIIPSMNEDFDPDFKFSWTHELLVSWDKERKKRRVSVFKFG